MYVSELSLDTLINFERKYYPTSQPLSYYIMSTSGIYVVKTFIKRNLIWVNIPGLSCIRDIYPVGLCVQLSTTAIYCHAEAQRNILWLWHHVDVICSAAVHLHVLGAFAQSRKAPLNPSHVRPSVYPHVSARLPLDGFPWNLILGTSMEVFRETPGVVKIGQICRALYMENYIRFNL